MDDSEPGADDPERELLDAVEELAETLKSLRSELERPATGPLGLPRPPTPREFLGVTERYTIPTLVSLLETGVRALELLAATIRLTNGRPLDDDETRRGGDTPERVDRLAAVSRETLRKLDGALADLESAATGGEPDSTDVRRLLEEARALRREVDDRLADATTSESKSRADPEPTSIPVESGDASPDAGSGAEVDDGDTGDDDGGAGDADAESVGVDVDRELESIKREFDESADDEGDDRDADDDAYEDDESGTRDDSTTPNGS